MALCVHVHFPLLNGIRFSKENMIGFYFYPCQLENFLYEASNHLDEQTLLSSPKQKVVTSNHSPKYSLLGMQHVNNKGRL